MDFPGSHVWLPEGKCVCLTGFEYIYIYSYVYYIQYICIYICGSIYIYVYLYICIYIDMYIIYSIYIYVYHEPKWNWIYTQIWITMGHQLVWIYTNKNSGENREFTQKHFNM